MPHLGNSNREAKPLRVDFELIEEDRGVLVTQLKWALITHLRGEAYFSIPAFLKINARRDKRLRRSRVAFDDNSFTRFATARINRSS
jgi:hypothetical protein